MPENGADIAHLNVLHQAGIGAGADLKDVERLMGKVLSHTWTAQWSRGESAHQTHIKVTHVCKLFERHIKFMDVTSTVRQVSKNELEKKTKKREGRKKEEEIKSQFRKC